MHHRRPARDARAHERDPLGRLLTSKYGSPPPTRCAAHRELFSCVEVDVRRGVVCDVLGINPLKKGTVPFFVDGYVRRGTGERDMGCSRRVSDNRQDSNQPRLARAPRGALRGLRPQAPPATFARRPVRRNRVSCSPVSRLASEHARREPFSDVYGSSFIRVQPLITLEVPRGPIAQLVRAPGS